MIVFTTYLRLNVHFGHAHVLLPVADTPQQQVTTALPWPIAGLKCRGGAHPPHLETMTSITTCPVAPAEAITGIGPLQPVPASSSRKRYLILYAAVVDDPN